MSLALSGRAGFIAGHDNRRPVLMAGARLHGERWCNADRSCKAYKRRSAALLALLVANNANRQLPSTYVPRALA